METITVTISAGQNLSDVLKNGIPTNTILNKTVCGIGATTLEIITPRHSIIIEPNVPVIKGKEKKHAEVLGVYEGVNVTKIREYIVNTRGYRKIMTTPESFYRVKEAIRGTDMWMRRDYFILFDECEKIVQDVDYRARLTLPIDDFFASNGKAMVSATPIMPRDPRFEEQNFKVLKVVPDYDYRKRMTIMQTNNVFTLLSYVLAGLPEDRKLCFFFNSTSGISRLVDRLGINDQAIIYCSQEAAKRLRDQGYNAHDTLRIDAGTVQLTKYTFLTSRFFSAVDIDLKEEDKPTVIILTELYSAPHSMIDPITESVQILGRFRNGIKSACHILNNNNDIEVRTDEDLEEFLAGEHSAYEVIYKLNGAAESEGAKAVLMQALKTVDYSRYVTYDCQINHFMYDNAFNNEHTMALYKEYDSVYDAYARSGSFVLDWKKFTMKYSDKDREKLENPELSRETMNRMVFEIVRELQKRNNDLDKLQLAELQESFGTIIDAFKFLGPSKIQEVGFKEKDLKAAIATAKAFEKENSIGVRQAVYNQFREFSWFSAREINEKLSEIYRIFNITMDRRGMAKKIALYYDAVMENHTNERGWKLGVALFKENVI